MCCIFQYPVNSALVNRRVATWRLWNDDRQGKTEVLRGNSIQCHLLHHQSLMDYPRLNQGFRRDKMLLTSCLWVLQQTCARTVAIYHVASNPFDLCNSQVTWRRLCKDGMVSNGSDQIYMCLSICYVSCKQYSLFSLDTNSVSVESPYTAVMFNLWSSITEKPEPLSVLTTRTVKTSSIQQHDESLGMENN